MKNIQKKRGFTIVELVIVIAVIAILAAVLIPTFSNVIARAKISADTQLCRNLNTVLTMATSEGRVPGSMYDVLYLVSESGYLLGNLNPTAEGYYYAWDSQGQKIVYIREDLDTVVYPEDYTIDKSKCWITVGDKEEAERVAAKGYNLYLEKNIDSIELTNVAVSIDTGAFKLGSLTINGESANQKDVVLAGNFGETSLNIANTSFSTTGTMSSLNIGSSTASMSINGNVGSLSSSITNTTMSQTGAIGEITSGKVTSGSTTFTSTSTGNISGAAANGNKISIGTKEDIENIRTQIANGRTFEGETVQLSNDVNMAGIAFQPISNYYRKSSKTPWFRGEIDGQGYTIKNFSTNGFSITGLNAGTNSTSVPFNGNTYNEAVYGLFGSIYVPAGKEVTIKNLNIEAAIDMTIDDGNKYVGDSVGALIGFVSGDGTLIVENVTVSGYINGYDGVAAFIGRAYGDSSTLTVKFKNCTNNAAVTAPRKCGGFIGSDSAATVVYEGTCVNNGNIWCKGIVEDTALGAGDIKDTWVDGSGYYRAGAASYKDLTEVNINNTSTKATLPANITNNGTVKVGEVVVAYN